MKVNIDRFDLLNWMHGCAIGSHLRQGIWQRAVDAFYAKLTEDEREDVYTYAKRDLTPVFLPKEIGGSSYQHFGHEDFFHFLACYNPANRYSVHLKGTLDGKDVDQWVDAYRWQDEFHVSFSRLISPDFLAGSKPVGKYKKCSLKCMWHDHCARYRKDADDTLSLYANSKCDWCINTKTEHGADVEHFK